MKLIKILFWTNLTIFLATVLSYAVAVVYGLLGQALLGLVQIVSAIILLFSWSILTKKNRKLLLNYGIISLIYLPFAYLVYDSIRSTNEALIAVGIITPLVIAAYFIFALHRIKSNRAGKKQINDYPVDM